MGGGCSLVFRLWVLVWGGRGGVSCGKERGLCVFVFLGLGKKAIELWFWVFFFCKRGVVLLVAQVLVCEVLDGGRIWVPVFCCGDSIISVIKNPFRVDGIAIIASPICIRFAMERRRFVGGSGSHWAACRRQLTPPWCAAS